MNRGPTNSWFEPQSLLGIAGFLSLIWSGYQQFQRDTTADVYKLTERIAVLEAQVAYLGRGR